MAATADETAARHRTVSSPRQDHRQRPAARGGVTGPAGREPPSRLEFVEAHFVEASAKGRSDPEIAEALLAEFEKKQIPEIWINPGAESDSLMAEAKRRKLNVIYACSIVGIGRSPSQF